MQVIPLKLKYQKPISVCKECWIKLGLVKSKLCNPCLRESIFPKRLRTAKIICEHKGGAHDVISNYYPISILPPFVKIIEKIIADEFYYFFEQNSLLTNTQYGFRMGMSTESADYNLIDLIVRNKDKGKLPVCLWIWQRP